MDKQLAPAQIADQLLDKNKPQLKKQAKKDKTEKIKEPVKQYFDVRVETMLPATLTYRILAEDAEQAINLIKGKHPTKIKYSLNNKRDIKVIVYEAGCSIIKFIKSLKL